MWVSVNENEVACGGHLVRSPGSWNHPMLGGFCEQNSSSLGEQQDFLAIEPSLHPHLMVWGTESFLRNLKLTGLARFWPWICCSSPSPSTELQVMLPFLGFILGLGNLRPCQLAVSPAPWGSSASKHWGHVLQLIIKINSNKALKHSFKVEFTYCIR